MRKIGAHVSAALSLDLSFNRAQQIGASCTQIFISPPQQWTHTNHTDEQIEKYRIKCEEVQIKPNYVHGTYLINLASQNPQNLQKSIEWLIYSQNMAEKLGIEGTIFHIGSSGSMDRQKALEQVVRAIGQILTDSGSSKLILETSAGSGNTIGDEFFELGYIIKSIADNRIKVCLDTQHVFASGYNIRTKEGLDRVVEEFDREIGLNKLVVIHTNDSKVELGSYKDRHENIGEGFIGLEGFRNIINHPAFKDLPFILEVPGFANDGPDKENIEIIKSLII